MLEQLPAQGTPTPAQLLTPDTVVVLEHPLFAQRIRAQVVGTVEGRYIMLRSSGNRRFGTLATLSPQIGDKLILRTFRDGVACGFTSDILATVRTPELLVFLRYPEEIEHINMRAHRRLRCRLPCLLELDGGPSVPALMLDVSAGGSRVACANLPDEVPADRAVSLFWSLPSAKTREGSRHSIKGRILRRIERSGHNVLVIRFDESPETSVEQLFNFLRIDEDATEAEVEETAAGSLQ